MILEEVAIQFPCEMMLLLSGQAHHGVICLQGPTVSDKFRAMTWRLLGAAGVSKGLWSMGQDAVKAGMNNLLKMT